MIKYAANSFLAVKISFINEIANVCEKLKDCDVTVVAKTIGMDKRISPYFLNSGIVWGDLVSLRIRKQ
jgi:UDPglucose 6-dehydrogenase